MAAFARLVSGVWTTTTHVGTSISDTWEWGPGRHSLSMLSEGTSSSGTPWRSIEVLYWHPGRGQFRRLGINPFNRSVAEGTVAFAGNSAESHIDMHQTTGLRRLRSRWTFVGPDAYRDELFEDSGSGVYEPLASWDRIRMASQPPQGTPDTPHPRPSRYIDRLEPFLGLWELADFRVAIEYVPHADAVRVRVRESGAAGEAGLLLDAYAFHHTGTQELRTIALSRRGGVYEGTLVPVEDGSLQFALKGYEGPGIVELGVRLDLLEGGMVRYRLCSVAGAKATPIEEGVGLRSNELHYPLIKLTPTARVEWVTQDESRPPQ